MFSTPATSIEYSPQRSTLAYINLVLLRPKAFFDQLTQLNASRQWLWVALIIMALVGYSAIRIEDADNTDSTGIDFPADQSDFSYDMSGPVGEPAPVTDNGGETSAETTDPDAVFETWSTGFLAATIIVFQWFGIAFILVISVLLSRKTPSFSKNLQVAIWSTLPLGLMAALRIIYILAGGEIGEGGLTGLLSEWKDFSALPGISQKLIFSFATQLTLFWVWSLYLILIGAQRTLQVRMPAALLAVLFWVAFLTALPVTTGDVDEEKITAITQDHTTEVLPDSFSLDETPLLDSEDFPGDIIEDEMPAGEIQ